MSLQENQTILQQLQKMDLKIDNLSTELHNTNIEMTKIAGMKFALNDIKIWKNNLENIVNAEDLREMKKALQEIKTSSEDILQVDAEVKELKKDKEKYREEINELKEFKTKAKTVFAILATLFAMAITIIGWFIS